MGRLYNVFILRSEADEVSPWCCLFTPRRRYSITNKSSTNKNSYNFKRSIMPTVHAVTLFYTCRAFLWFSDWIYWIVKGLIKLTFTIGRSGLLLKASDSLYSNHIVLMQSSAFVSSISATSTFLLKHTQNTHRQPHMPSTPVFQIVNQQRSARWQMSTVTWLNTDLHFYYSYVLLCSLLFWCGGFMAQNIPLRFLIYKT